MAEGIIHLSDLSFRDEVLAKDDLILVLFYAAYSLGCQKLGVILSDLAPKYEGKIKIAKLDIDKNPGITSRYRVTSTPTLILFKNGEEQDRIVGEIGEEELINYIEKATKG